MGIKAAIPPMAATFRLHVRRWSQERGVSSLVAGLDEQLDIGVHEGRGHGDVGSVGHDGVLVRPLRLDTGG